MMYISKNNKITKRMVKIIKVDENSFRAFCFTRNAKRTFMIENILSLFPVIESRGVS